MAVVDRIRKLLELSRNNNSPDEAASAATEAQRLMFKFQIQESDLVLDEEERKPEAIVEDGIDSGHKDRVVWKACLANALAEGFGAEMYSTRGANGMKSFQIYGLESSVQTVKYMYGYLAAEIMRLSEEAWREHGHEQRLSPRTWCNNFRMGAVNTIRKRLQEQREVQNVEVRERVAAAKREQKPQSTALALYQTNEERVEQGFKALSKRLGLVTRKSYARSNPTAYQHGAAAGAGVNLGGGRGLGAPARGIRS